MKTFVLCLALLSGWMVSQSARAEESPQEMLQVYSFETCNFFMYSPEARGYLCASPGGRITAPSVTELTRINEQLNQRIAELEGRIRKLEGAHPN